MICLLYINVIALFWRLFISKINNGERQNKSSQGNQDGTRVNNEISAQKLRLIDNDGQMLGVFSSAEALRLAREAGLDLVEISPNANPPVCKILDYGKYKYELQKKKNEAKKKQKVIEVKEIQMRPMIDTNDLDIKCKAIKRFLDDGSKVKIVMRFRGRELSHHEIGMKILLGIKEQFESMIKVDFAPKLEGKQMIMIISPIKN